MYLGLTAGSEHQRDHEPLPSASRPAGRHFQVNFKFGKYWSHNMVRDGEETLPELRFCPKCLAFIQHDERGYPVCIECGLEFPAPPAFEPTTPEKAEKHHAANMRKFVGIVQDLAYMSELREFKSHKSHVSHDAPDHIAAPTRKKRHLKMTIY